MVRSWPELQQAVRRTRKLATAMMSRVPHSFRFRHVTTPPDGATQTRLYFLGVPEGARENTLLYVDVPQVKSEHAGCVMLWSDTALRCSSVTSLRVLGLYRRLRSYRSLAQRRRKDGE